MKRYWLLLIITISLFCTINTPATIAQTDRPLADYPVITAENVAGLQQVRVLGEGYINDVIFSPDEQFVVMATTVGIWLYSIDDLETPIRLFGDYAINVTYAMFSPDGSRLFGGTKTGWIYVWDVETGEQITELFVYRDDGKISYFQLSDDEKYLYVISSDLLIWNLEGNYLERSISLDTSLSVLSPDLKYLIKEIYLRDTREWKTVVVDTNTSEILYFLERSFYYPRFDETSSYITAIYGYSGGVALVWDVETGELLYEVREHGIGYDTEQVISKSILQEENHYTPCADGAILSRDQTKIITFDTYFNIGVWDIATDTLLYAFPDATQVYCPFSGDIARHPWKYEEVSDATQFVEDENLIGRIIQYFSYPEYSNTGGVRSYRISPNRTYASLYSQTSVSIWDVQTYELIFNLPSERHCGGGGTSSLALDNTRLISRSPYGVCVWDFENQNAISTYSYTTSSLGNMISDGKYVAVVNTTFEGDALEQIIIWNLETGISIDRICD